MPDLAPGGGRYTYSVPINRHQLDLSPVPWGRQGYTVIEERKICGGVTAKEEDVRVSAYYNIISSDLYRQISS